MKHLYKILTLSFIIITAACSGSPDRITGGVNPEATALPPDPSFSGEVSFAACVSAINAALSQSKCFQRGDSSNENYTEVWFSPDSSGSASGVMGYETKQASNSVTIEYEISNCDAGEVRMTQANGFTVTVSGNQLDLEFDDWDQAFRYTATNNCTLSE